MKFDWRNLPLVNKLMSDNLLIISDRKATKIKTQDLGKVETVVLRNVDIDAEDAIHLCGYAKVLIIADLHYASPLKEIVEACRDNDGYESEGSNVDASLLQGLEWIIDIGNTDGEEGCWCLVANKLPTETLNTIKSIDIETDNGKVIIHLPGKKIKGFNIQDSAGAFLKEARRCGLPLGTIQYFIDTWSVELEDLDEFGFPPDKLTFSLLKNAMKKNSKLMDANIQKQMKSIDKCDHQFIVPPELRNGTVTEDHIKQWLILNYGIEDGILFGPDALKALEFLFKDQEDDDYDIEDGKRLVQACACVQCTSPIVGYGVCDFVYPLQKTWFGPYYGLCEVCYLFHPLEEALNSILPQVLIEMIKNYQRHLYTMACIDEEEKVNIQITSSITEWLPIAYYNASYDSDLLLVTNCNPQSKFYRWIFTYQHEGNDCKEIHLDDLAKIKVG